MGEKCTNQDFIKQLNPNTKSVIEHSGNQNVSLPVCLYNYV